MKKFIKSALPLIAITAVILIASCGNAVAKNTYQCDEEQEITIEFANDNSFVAYCTAELRDKRVEVPEGEEPMYTPKKLQLATGTYRVNGKLLTITVGTGRDLESIYEFKPVDENTEAKVPSLVRGLHRGAEFTFQIQDGGKLTSNFDGNTWTKQQ